MKTLFLDFDGVLHPYSAPTSRLLVRVIHFERVMRQFPEWQIVISSAWREHTPLDELRHSFAPDIAERIVGATPLFSKLDVVPDGLRHFEREAECQAWLNANGRAREPWIALDDWDWLFSPQSPNLFLVDGTTGLDRAHAKRLVKHLAAF